MQLNERKYIFICNSIITVLLLALKIWLKSTLNVLTSIYGKLKYALM